jgi:hypothetical protein
MLSQLEPEIEFGYFLWPAYPTWLWFAPQTQKKGANLQT